MMKMQFIRAPRPGTMAMLLRRTHSDVQKEMEGKNFDAVGLVQTELSTLFYLADVGQKAADVYVAEIIGNCPQHISTMAFFGNTAAVTAALAAITQAAQREP